MFLKLLMHAPPKKKSKNYASQGLLPKLLLDLKAEKRVLSALKSAVSRDPAMLCTLDSKILQVQTH